MTFHAYDTREEWLKGRSGSIGASSMAEFMVTHLLPEPMPKPGTYTNLDDALAFGSAWEPAIALAYADKTGLKMAGRNIRFEDLKPGTMSWHDDSFYLEDGLHCSFDAIARLEDGSYRVVEFKTSSASSEKFIGKKFRERYHRQVNVERIFAERITRQPVEMHLVFIHRPDAWKAMEPKDINDLIREDMFNNEETIIPVERDASDLTPEMEWNLLLRYRNEYLEREKNGGYISSGDGDHILARILELEEEVSDLKEDLKVWLDSHPGYDAMADGKVAKLVTSSRTTTDWKKFIGEKGYSTEGLEAYQKTSHSESLSITKQRKKRD